MPAETTEPPSTDVVRQVLAGDVDAYARIVEAHQHDIWRVVAYALRDRGATEDLVQQVFLTAYVKLDQFDPDRDLGAWLRTIARNQVRNELRRSSRETRWMSRYRDHLSQRLERSEVAEEAEAELRHRLAECRKELAAPAREALQLRYEQSKGFDEIAERLGRTVAATRQLLSRVRGALRRCLEARGAPA